MNIAFAHLTDSTLYSEVYIYVPIQAIYPSMWWKRRLINLLAES